MPHLVPRAPFLIAPLAALLVLVCALGLPGLPGLPGPARADPVGPVGPAAPSPPPDTITSITGDAADGFDITFYDGTSLHPPTDSEARAECSEYETRVARVRCATEVRTWHRDLAATQQALAWAGFDG